MIFAIKWAYMIFKQENPEIQVSYSKFHMLKPKNVKISSKTPLISSLCPYCHNIRLKLQKLGIADLKIEHDLFNKLICETDHTSLENANCISKHCVNCNDWEGKIETLLSSVPNQDKDITWFTWEKGEYTSKNGKKGVRRDLVCKKGTFKKFQEELIEDILHPAKKLHLCNIS